MDSFQKVITYTMAAVVGLWAGSSLQSCTSNQIPYKNKIQSGFAIPSKLEITVEDLDHNGVSETYLRYDETTYMLTYDGKQPKIVPYKIIEAKIAPKE